MGTFTPIRNGDTWVCGPQSIEVADVNMKYVIGKLPLTDMIGVTSRIIYIPLGVFLKEWRRVEEQGE